MCFRKKKTVEIKKLSKQEMTIIKRLENADDDLLKSLGKNIMDGEPIIIDFSNIDVDEANKSLAFLTGVTYALNGFVLEIKEAVYLFVDSFGYDDGTLQQLLDQIHNRSIR